MDRIQLDLSHALEEHIGPEHGLRAAELAGLAPAAAHAVRVLWSRRGQDLRWLDTEAVAAGHERILEWADEQRGRFRTLVVLGVGPAALPVQALRSALNSPFHNLTTPGDLPRLIVLDNIDPDLVGEFLDCVDPSECLFHAVTHSGSTPATLAQFQLMRAALREALGDEAHRSRMVVTTGAGGGELRALAQREGYASFDVPEGVPERFAALSPAGLVPAALLGIDTPGLLAGAQAMGELCLAEDPLVNPALGWAAACQLLRSQHAKTIAVTLSYSTRLRDLGPWTAQLIAGALHAPTPLSAVGVSDVHSQLPLWTVGARDKWFTTLSVEKYDHSLAVPGEAETLGELFAAEREGTREALQRAGVPQIDLRFPSVNAHTLGQYFQLQQIAVALAAEFADLDVG